MEDVMVWRWCMAAAGVGKLVFIDSNMDEHLYQQILQNNLKPSALQLGIPLSAR